MKPEYIYDWADLAFASKKEVRNLKATFIAASREFSLVRFTELIRKYLPGGHIILGVAKEGYVDGFDGQSQFRAQDLDNIQATIDVVNAKSKHKIYVLRYHQREAPILYEKLSFRQVVLINGSWLYSFHTRPDYYALMRFSIPYVMESPFKDENEAREYETRLAPQIAYTVPTAIIDEASVMLIAKAVSRQSYDTSFQVGIVAADKEAAGYRIRLTGYNKVVPYQTYALHFGASRERHFSPPGDQNYYDTAHDAIALMSNAIEAGVSLAGMTIFANLLPCPTCARALCLTDVAEIVYELDHSDGYAVALLEAAGKKVRRLVTLKDVV
jgi:deoxycytidylate deaminase